MRVVIPFAALAILLALGRGAQAQVPSVGYALALHEAPDQPVLPFGGAERAYAVEYAISCASPQVGGAEVLQGRLEFTAPADGPVEVAAASFSVDLPDCVRANSTNGTVTLQASAKPGAPGIQLLPLDVEGTLRPVQGGSSTAPCSCPVAMSYNGAFTAVALDAQAEAGPQKQIPFPIRIRNEGNAQTMYTFTLAPGAGGAAEARGRWYPILPEVLILGAGEEAVATFTVNTPFANGYQSDARDFTVQAHAQATATNEPGPSIDVPVHADSDGWYIPGPTPTSLAAILGLAALAAKGRAMRR